MKIGILTYYGDLNCGTNLQAFSTLKAVKSIYPNDCVEIIPFHGFKPDIHPYFSNCTIKSLLNDWTRIRKYQQFKKQQLEVKSDRIIQSPVQALAYIKNCHYDVIFIGADTLLELNRLPRQYDGLSAYWLSPEIKAKKYCWQHRPRMWSTTNCRPSKKPTWQQRFATSLHSAYEMK